MTEPTKKPQEKPPKQTIITAFSPSFYVCTVIGILPFSIPTYFKEKKLQISWLANAWCVLNMINLSVNYHFAIGANYSEDENSTPKSSKSSEVFPPRTFP